ncbi:hypothetical protein MTO96_031425 [Rhipicephalus appendiculatus]
MCRCGRELGVDAADTGGLISSRWLLYQFGRAGRAGVHRHGGLGAKVCIGNHQVVRVRGTHYMIPVTHPLAHTTRSHDTHTIRHWAGASKHGSTEPPQPMAEVANTHEVTFAEHALATSVATGFPKLLVGDFVVHRRPHEVQPCSEAPPQQQNRGCLCLSCLRSVAVR